MHDVTNVEQHELLGFDASRPLPDVIPERENSLAVVACSAVTSKQLPQRAQSGMSAMHALKSKARRGNAFRASRQVSENSEWFKKLDPGAQFQ